MQTATEAPGMISDREVQEPSCFTDVRVISAVTFLVRHSFEEVGGS